MDAKVPDLQQPGNLFPAFFFKFSFTCGLRIALQTSKRHKYLPLLDVTVVTLSEHVPIN